MLPPDIPAESEGVEVVLGGNEPSVATTDEERPAAHLVGGASFSDVSNEDSEDEDMVSEQDPDDVEDEDIPVFTSTVEAEQAEFNKSDFAAARGIETNNDKHKAKWDRYIQQKEALIEEEWTVTCKPPKKQKIDVGERVEEKSGNKPVGVVIAND